MVTKTKKLTNEMNRLQLIVDAGFDIVGGNLKLGRIKLGESLDHYFVALDFKSLKKCRLALYKDFSEAFDVFEATINNQ